MTLQDDIARYATGNRVLNTYDGSERIIQRIAAGLERDYCLVKLDSLPDVEETARIVSAGDAVISEDFPVWEVWDVVRDHLALALHLEARESEAAVLARRRDKLARELGCRGPNGVGYERSTEPYQRAIDRIIELEAQVAS